MDEKEKMEFSDAVDEAEFVTDGAAEDNGEAPKSKKKNAGIRAIIIVVGLLFALIAVRVVSSMEFVADENEHPQGGTNNGSMTETWRPRDLYDPDWETDIFTIKEYTDKQPNCVTYGMYNGSIVEYSEVLVGRDKCLAAGGSPLALLYDYFDRVRHGDHEAVIGFYDERYFDGEETKPYWAYPGDFPMQKVYDLNIRKYNYVNEEFENTLESANYYLVTYKIMENDGYFRYDLDADTEIPQLIGIITHADGTSSIYMQMELPNFAIRD